MIVITFFTLCASAQLLSRGRCTYAQLLRRIRCKCAFAQLCELVFCMHMLSFRIKCVVAQLFMLVLVCKCTAFTKSECPICKCTASWN